MLSQEKGRPQHFLMTSVECSSACTYLFTRSFMTVTIAVLAYLVNVNVKRLSARIYGVSAARSISWGKGAHFPGADVH